MLKAFYGRARAREIEQRLAPQYPVASGEQERRMIVNTS